MRLPRRRHLNAWAKFVGYAASTTGAAYLALTEANVWHPHPGWQFAAVAVNAGMALFAGSRTTYFELTKPAVEKRDASIRARLEAAWFGVAKETGIDPKELLVSLFLFEGLGRWRHLKRLMRVGVKQIGESNVRWTKGKGVIGKCWETEATQRMDLTKINAKHGKCTAEQWEKANGETKTTLPFADWEKTRRKYDMVIAVPIHRDSHFIGCVALTGPTHNTVWLDDSKVEESLVGAATAIATMSRL